MTILLNHIVIILNDNLHVHLFIQWNFIVFIDHSVDTTIVLWIQQWRRQHNPCPYGFIVETTRHWANDYKNNHVTKKKKKVIYVRVAYKSKKSTLPSLWEEYTDDTVHESILV